MENGELEILVVYQMNLKIVSVVISNYSYKRGLNEQKSVIDN